MAQPKSWLVLVCLLLGAGGTLSAAPIDAPLIEAHYIMGTIFRITLYAANPEAGRRAMRAAFQEINRIDRKMSNYKPDSELSRMNRAAAKRPFRVSDELFWIIGESVKYATLTDGAFDITVSPLLKLWGFYKGRGHWPSRGELDRARAGVGYKRLLMDDRRKTIFFTTPGTEVDLGGIAKGYAIDRAADILRRQGMTSALLSGGQSTILAMGAPPGKDSWRVNIRDPKDLERILGVLKLRDQSVCTSGNYEKFFRINGKIYGHIFDPRTGQPVQGIYSATIVAPQAVRCDALSTSVFVLGFEKGMALLEQLEDVLGLVVGAGAGEKGYRIEYSPGMERVIENR